MVGIFPTHFFDQKIRPSMTTSKEGLKTFNIPIYHFMQLSDLAIIIMQ